MFQKEVTFFCNECDKVENVTVDAKFLVVWPFSTDTEIMTSNTNFQISCGIENRKCEVDCKTATDKLDDKGQCIGVACDVFRL